ncbi:MAG TPA: hypothetical protein VGS06_33100 [Streptosporangiaceae bacterium]|nr:hypothetical protein [Streptosporangiaceae bacterium]
MSASSPVSASSGLAVFSRPIVVVCSPGSSAEQNDPDPCVG